MGWSMSSGSAKIISDLIDVFVVYLAGVDDGTKLDACDGSGSCAGAPYACEPNLCQTTSVHNGTDCDVTPLNCDDTVACTVDDCDPATGCTHAPDNGLCDDDGDKPAGLDAARARGRTGGRPRKLSEGDLRAARAMLLDEGITVVDVARRLGVSPATLYRHMPAARARVREE